MKRLGLVLAVAGGVVMLHALVFMPRDRANFEAAGQDFAREQRRFLTIGVGLAVGSVVATGAA